MEKSEYFNTDASTLFKVKKIQIQMLKDRGYDVTDEMEVLTMGIEQFIKRYMEKKKTVKPEKKLEVSFKSVLQQEYINPNITVDNNNKIFIFYPETPVEKKKIGKETANQIISVMNSNKYIHVIIISEMDFTPDAKKSFLDLKLYHIEHFLYNQLSYNPTNHFLVPKHRLMSDEESKAFTIKNNIDRHTLPKISHQDPISKYYGAIPGQIFEITRERVIIDAPISVYIIHRLVESVELEAGKEEKKG